MSTSLPQLTAFTNASWNEEPFQFFLGSVNSPDDFTGASFAMGLRAAGSATTTFHLTDGNGRLAVTLPNEVAITVDDAGMATLAPGPYSFDLVVTRADGQVENILQGVVQVVQGIAP